MHLPPKLKISGANFVTQNFSSWSPDGRILATGSNDKTVKLSKILDDNDDLIDKTESCLSFHEGTVRDCCWISGGQSLVSGGAGDDQLFMTDCHTGRKLFL